MNPSLCIFPFPLLYEWESDWSNSVKNKGARILIAIALWLPTLPVFAFDSGDFPIRVYVNPFIVGTEKSANPVPVPENKLLALRQGVADWVQLIGALPDKPNDQTYAIVLRRSETPIDTAKINRLGFLVFVDSSEQADLVVEAREKYNLQGEDARYETATIGLFSPKRGYRIGKISMSLLNADRGPVDTLDLRIVLIHEFGHSLGLNHVDKSLGCNVMSPEKYTCEQEYPAGCDGRNDNIKCIGITDKQLRFVESQLFAAPDPAKKKPVAAASSGNEPELSEEIANLYNRAIEKTEKKDFQGAIDNYSKVIAAEPKFANAYFNRGNIYFNLNDFKNSVKDYDQYIKLEPNKPEGYNARSNARYKAGDRTGALADYDQLIALKADDERLYYNRGVLLNEVGDTKGTIESYSKAISLKQDYELAYFNRGLLREKSKDFKGAIEDLSKCLEIHPDDAKTYRYRGNIRYNLKDVVGAQADWQKAADLYQQKGDTESYKQVKSLLDRGRK
jgi:tetratricopeptide (TPR) repeat protein